MAHDLTILQSDEADRRYKMAMKRQRSAWSNLQTLIRGIRDERQTVRSRSGDETGTSVKGEGGSLKLTHEEEDYVERMQHVVKVWGVSDDADRPMDVS